MSGFGEAVFEILVGGVNVTERFNPILEHLEVTDHSGETSAKAKIVLADVDGEIMLPSRGDDLSIQLGWVDSGAVQVFDGTVDDVRSRGGRHQGRQLHIDGHGFDTGGKAKEPLEFHKDKASLNDFMGEAANRAGFSFSAQGTVAAIQRDYWAAGTESFIALGHRVAREVGAIFKLQGRQAFMWPLNTPLFGVGGGDGSVRAEWSAFGNLIDWDIAPILARPRYGKTRTRYYDVKGAAWKEQSGSVGGIGSDYAAEHTHRYTRADQDEAEKQTDADEATSQREAGSGTVMIKGEPAAMPEGTCIVIGVRPGVDGSYRIEGTTHRLDRHSGFTTHMDLKQPQGEAGEDNRSFQPDLNAGGTFPDSVGLPAANPPTDI